MFGSHLSIAGSLLNALDEAEKLGLDTVQIFTKNQQQWKCKPLDPAVIRDWRARIAALGWQSRTVSHASYLINLASPDDELWRKSVDLMHEEISRCDALGVPFLVHHPGAFTTSTREAGLARIADAYRQLAARTPDSTTVLCLENTVGGGSILGRDFAELAALRAEILNRAGLPPGRVGFCFDTCHAHAGGYDLSTPASAAAALAEWDRTCGLDQIRVLHLNDSKAAAGSRLDRHEHIGRGTIGPAGFAAILAEASLADRPKIMETPKGQTDAGVEHDTINLALLRSLMHTPPPALVEPRPAPARTPTRPARRSTTTPPARPRSTRPGRR